MTIGLLLTIVFAILKLTHTVDWSWWIVVLPAIIEAGIDILLVLLFFSGILAIAFWKDQL